MFSRGPSNFFPLREITLVLFEWTRAPLSLLAELSHLSSNRTVPRLERMQLLRDAHFWNVLLFSLEIRNRKAGWDSTLRQSLEREAGLFRSLASSKAVSVSGRHSEYGKIHWLLISVRPNQMNDSIDPQSVDVLVRMKSWRRSAQFSRDPYRLLALRMKTFLLRSQWNA